MMINGLSDLLLVNLNLQIANTYMNVKKSMDEKRNFKIESDLQEKRNSEILNNLRIQQEIIKENLK